MRVAELLVLERVAAGGYDLSEAEELTLSKSLEEQRRALALEELRESLTQGAADARRRARTIATGKGFGLRTRAKAAAGAVFPGFTGRMLLRRRRREWLGAGGIKIKQE
jgi:hypothetical protein